MKRPHFDAMIAKICAVFVFPYPQEETLAAWFDMAGTIEFGKASQWVCEEFCTRNKRITRGTNIGAELLELGKEYRKNAYVHAVCAEQKGCKNCSDLMPGFIFTSYFEGTRPYRCVHVCVCNTDPRYKDRPHRTLDDVINHGYSPEIR